MARGKDKAMQQLTNDMDELRQRITELDRSKTKNSRVDIVSSGYASDPIMAYFKKYGFSAVMSKPYSIEGLAEVLHSLIV